METNISDRELLEKIAKSSKRTADAVSWLKGYFITVTVLYSLWLVLMVIDWFSRQAAFR